MTSLRKQILSYLTLTAGACSFICTGLTMQPVNAQEVDASIEDNAVEISENDALPEGEAEAQEVVVVNIGPDPNAKGAPESPYMHGCSDEKATPVSITGLLGATQANFKDDSTKLPLLGVGTGPVIALENGSVKLDGEVLNADVLQDNRGEILRFHIWIKGEGITAKESLWSGAPTLTFELYDDNGNLVTDATSGFKTRGTFPWHNYYVDVKLPKSFMLTGKAAASSGTDTLLAALGLGSEEKATKPGLYLTLSNFGGGKAWFGGLSYERISAKEQKDKSNWLDDATASMAPNPQYDELPMMLFYGLDTKLPWRFLAGNKAFSNIQTISGLKAYVQSAKNDWFQMQKGVAMLPYIYVTANTLNLTDGFDEGWMDALQSELEALQDPKTGFWLIDGVPNLFVTEAIASHCFSPRKLSHGDKNIAATPWNAVGPDATLRYGQNIIRTLLDARIPNTPAWNGYAFQPKEMGGLQRNTKAELTATATAVKLLALAITTITDDDKEYGMAVDAIQSAYDYAVANFVLKSGYLWSDSNLSGAPAASPEGMLELIDASRVLENRIDEELPTPVLTCKRRESAGLGKATITWANPEKGLDAVRIYAAPAEFNPNFLNEKYLIGVIEKPNALPKNQDPLMLAIRLVNAAKNKWGVTPAELNADYVAEKTANAAQFLGQKRLTAAVAGEKPVTMNVSSPIGFGYTENESGEVTIKLYAVGVKASGETTHCISLDAEDEDLREED